MKRLRVAAGQLDPVVGDLDGNVAAVLRSYDEAERAGCDLLVLPELVVTGYPPEDLLLKPRFVADNHDALAKIAARTGDCVAAVGVVDGRDGRLRNAVAMCARGEVVGWYAKRRLPNYSVFDEQRYFVPGEGDPSLFLVGGVRVGFTVCEDAWVAGGPVAAQGVGGAELVANLNASPYYRGRLAERESMLSARAVEAGCPVVYVNLVGGQDELVFDGASLVVDASGAVIGRGPQFEELVWVVDVDVPERPPGPLPVVEVTETPHRRAADDRPLTLVLPLARATEVYEALVTGTRDYVVKNGFRDVVVGLSGGVDSSLVATIAVDAIGAEHVHGVSMPSRYSSEGSKADAGLLARNLGIDHRTISIEGAHNAFLDMLAPSFAGLPHDLTEENLQARIRGTTLMALSNKFGWLVLTTGNKSEMAAGYATLYGDMAGGFAVLKDVPKMLVYELCRDRNARAGRALVPETVLAKPPSAELRPDQRDDDSLPPYEVLDPILEAYVERDRTAAELEDEGLDPALVRRVASMVDRAEYKRRQAPPGPRVSPKAFGKDRRLPITNRYHG